MPGPTISNFNTWNRYLAIAANYGGLDADQLLQRTLSITYVDRATEFDFLEWKLDNRDGYLTRLENIAAGVLVSVKIGYTDFSIPWKTFVVTRLKGGVGSLHNANTSYPMAENEGTITYEARNRNAPGGKITKRKRTADRRTHIQRTKRKSKGRKLYTPTNDVLNTEVSMQQGKPSIIRAPTTSEAVQQIAIRNGYKLEDIYIEDTNDSITHVSIPPGVTDFQWVAMMANKFGYIVKSEKDFRFHSPYWEGDSKKIIAKLIYGQGKDILKLDIDADFRLPVPHSIKTINYDWKRRAANIQNKDADELSKLSNMRFFLNEGLLSDPLRSKLLYREEAFPVVGNRQTADKKAIKKFLQRNWAAFQINLDTVGHPGLLATRQIELGGTGSPLVDGIWYISEARHVINATEYITQISLKHPRKQKPVLGGNRRDPGVIANKQANEKRKIDDQRFYLNEGLKIKRTVRE